MAEMRWAAQVTGQSVVSFQAVLKGHRGSTGKDTGQTERLKGKGFKSGPSKTPMHASELYMETEIKADLRKQKKSYEKSIHCEFLQQERGTGQPGYGKGSGRAPLSLELRTAEAGKQTEAREGREFFGLPGPELQLGVMKGSEDGWWVMRI